MTANSFIALFEQFERANCLKVGDNDTLTA